MIIKHFENHSLVLTQRWRDSAASAAKKVQTAWWRPALRSKSCRTWRNILACFHRFPLSRPRSAGTTTPVQPPMRRGNIWRKVLENVEKVQSWGKHHTADSNNSPTYWHSEQSVIFSSTAQSKRSKVSFFPGEFDLNREQKPGTSTRTVSPNNTTWPSPAQKQTTNNATTATEKFVHLPMAIITIKR